MATNKNATIRYQTLDKCFRDPYNRYYLEDLIEKCEEALESFNFVGGVSRRQIYDDIRFMESEAGWQIELNRKKDGKRVYYKYKQEDFTINKQPLTDKEAQLFKTAILTLNRFRGLPSNEWVDELISNLEGRFNLNGTIKNVISFEQNANLKGLPFLSPLIKAASNSQVLKISYFNYKEGGKEIEFIFHPYYIKQYNNRWFAFGYDTKSDKIAHLALDRIVSMQELSTVDFIKNKKIDFETYFQDVVGVSIPKDNIEKQVIQLKFSKPRFPYVVSKPIHDSQVILNQEECIISLEVRPNRELDQQILSFGCDVKVLCPTTYKHRIMKNIQENYKLYFTVQDGCT